MASILSFHQDLEGVHDPPAPNGRRATSFCASRGPLSGDPEAISGWVLPGGTLSGPHSCLWCCLWGGHSCGKPEGGASPSRREAGRSGPAGGGAESSFGRLDSGRQKGCFCNVREAFWLSSFEMSSRDPFVGRALGVWAIFSRTSSILVIRGPARPDSTWSLPKRLPLQGMSNHCQGRGMPASSRPVSVPVPRGLPAMQQSPSQAPVLSLTKLQGRGQVTCVSCALMGDK